MRVRDILYFNSLWLANNSAKRHSFQLKKSGTISRGKEKREKEEENQSSDHIQKVGGWGFGQNCHINVEDEASQLHKN